MSSIERRAKELFLDALEQPSTERAAFVIAASGGDAALQKRVSELLQFHDVTVSGPDAIALVDICPGATIGPYRLVSRLGEGGFGVVFLAEQEQPVKRQVALKVVKLGMDTRRVIARFEHERHTLALMDHPNIAKVLDAGTTTSGRPYFVMERVKGVPLTEYCARRAVDLERRLEMFAAVCLAVHHAHQRGVIHRDLKPSNVLVAEVDGKPLPKVIDFGIAKAVEGELADHTQYTGQGQAIGTPAYMSPEQMEGALDVDTRADVYALGVILYQLLSDELPFDPDTIGFKAIKHAVLNDEPKPPSAVKSGKNKKDRADGTTTLQTIPRELDWVTLKCLAKDKELRYQSAAALAKDVERVLAHAPVEAAPPSLGYRARKFVRRHRVATAAAAIVLVALIGAAIAVTSAWVKAGREQRLAQNVNEFLVNDVLESMKPSGAFEKGNDVTMREVLDAAAARIDDAAASGGRFGDDPLIEAGVRNAIGGSYLTIGRLESAEVELARAEAVYRDRLGNADTRTLEVIGKHASALRGLGRLPEAEERFREVATERERLLGPNASEVTFALQFLAGTLASEGRFDEAEAICRHVLAIVPDDWVVGDQNTRAEIATSLALCGKKDEAIVLLRRAFEVDRATLGPTHSSTLQAETNLAAQEQLHGDRAEAKRLLEDVYTTFMKLRGADYPGTIVVAYHLGMLHMDDDDDSDAVEALLTQAYESSCKVHGASEATTLSVRSALAKLREMQNRPAEAETITREVLAAAERTTPPDESLITKCLNDLASELFGQEKYADAADVLKRLLDVMEQKPGKDDPHTVIVRRNLARVLRQLGRDAEAAALESRVASAAASAPATKGGG